MRTGRKYFIFLLLPLLLLASCNPARKVEQRGGYLLVKNTIKSQNSYLPTDELEGFLQQSALNGRLAPFIRPGISFYENSFKGKETKFKLFQRRSLGVKPIILDTLLCLATLDKLHIYLRNKGFYHSSVALSVHYKHKTASVTYLINSGPPCIVSKFSYNVPDTTMLNFIKADAENGKLRDGMIYDTYFLDDERDRIANMLRNNSYFNFSLSDIYYMVDTTNNGLAASVQMNIKNVKMKIPGVRDSITQIQHPRFYIKNIYITPDADLTSQVRQYDTLAFKYRLSKADTAVKTIYVLNNNENELKPSFLRSCLKFNPGDPYSQVAVNSSYKKLIGQPIIGSANINMSIKNQETIDSTRKQLLDCNIRLTRNRLNTFSLGTEGTNSAGRFGVGFSTSIQNRNLFKGAEVISLKLRTSAEIQGSNNSTGQPTEKYLLFFNTLEGGAEVSIDFPRMLTPYRPKYQQNLNKSLTSLSAGVGFELRPDYKRTVSTAALSYKWNKNEFTRHIFTPIELNYVKIFPTTSFQDYLDSLTDPQFKSQYTDHLLTMIRYSIMISNLGITKKNNEFYIRLNAETSGNIPYIIDNMTNKTKTESGYYERLGVRYANYFRFDVDFRKYWKLKFDNMLAFRFLSGVAFPYGNSESVPFEKTFWLGGANDMRGWRLRSLGPGAYVDPNHQYDKTGDIVLQSTIEHRFPIYSFLLGSIFIDAGNVWLRKESVDFPDGNFKLNTFYKQLAMDLGAGLRFDFSFFILRIDAAVPIKNPALAGSWFNSEDFRFSNTIWNFGIGYPF